ncbi:MAG TPA: HDIG domain-containing protein [Oceanithermus profundus]|uniref:HDIG domain-containing protein n=1 Tax=Oceanithermus profundus TaxID=187137 RepID=A0A7C4ZII3_9DEIN|nr:HDIG domain-containing protein [Oceanithermus profundus]
MPTYDEALALMHDWTPSESLRRHMYAVEAAMRAYARKFGEDEETWAIAGLIHDFDWEKHPETHPNQGADHLEALGWPAEIVRAVRAHAPERSGVEPETLMERALYAADEITGLITAAVYVRPDRSIHTLTVKSLKKKFKDKSFARGVDREMVRRGAELLGVELWEHVGFVLAAMQADAERLGLAGEAPPAG